MQSRSSRGPGRSHALGLCVGPRTRSWLSASFVGLLVIAALTAAPKCVQARKFGPQAAKTEGSQRAAYEAMFAASSSAPQLDQQNQAATSSPETQQQAAKQLYLLLYYVDTGATGIHAAVSTDGMHFHAVGPNEARSPVLMPTVGSPRVARDPSIAQNPKDGRFHLVWRAGWDDTMGYATSLDLVTWSAPKLLRVPGERRAQPAKPRRAATAPVQGADDDTQKSNWRPSVHYDAVTDRVWVIWASRANAQDTTTKSYGRKRARRRIMRVTTNDFQDFGPVGVLYEGGRDAEESRENQRAWNVDVKPTEAGTRGERHASLDDDELGAEDLDYAALVELQACADRNAPQCPRNQLLHALVLRDSHHTGDDEDRGGVTGGGAPTSAPMPSATQELSPETASERKWIRVAIGRSADGPFGKPSAPLNPPDELPDAVSMCRVNGTYVVYYGVENAAPGTVKAMATRDLRTYADISSHLRVPDGARGAIVAAVDARKLHVSLLRQAAAALDGADATKSGISSASNPSSSSSSSYSHSSRVFPGVAAGARPFGADRAHGTGVVEPATHHSRSRVEDAWGDLLGDAYSSGQESHTPDHVRDFVAAKHQRAAETLEALLGRAGLSAGGGNGARSASPGTAAWIHSHNADAPVHHGNDASADDEGDGFDATAWLHGNEEHDEV
ncbi:beta-xylosidase [Pycnococcus provasolii]